MCVGEGCKSITVELVSILNVLSLQMELKMFHKINLLRIPFASREEILSSSSNSDYIMLTIRVVHLDCSCSCSLVVLSCFYFIVISSTYSFRRMILAVPLYISFNISVYRYVMFVCMYAMEYRVLRSI